MNIFSSFWRSQQGSTLVEYALLIGGISAGCMFGLDFLSGLADTPLAELKSGITVHSGGETDATLSDDELIELVLATIGL